MGGAYHQHAHPEVSELKSKRNPDQPPYLFSSEQSEGCETNMIHALRMMMPMLVVATNKMMEVTTVVTAPMVSFFLVRNNLEAMMLSGHAFARARCLSGCRPRSRS